MSLHLEVKLDMTNNVKYEELCKKFNEKKIIFEEFSRLTKRVGLEKTQER